MYYNYETANIEDQKTHIDQFYNSTSLLKADDSLCPLLQTEKQFDSSVGETFNKSFHVSRTIWKLCIDYHSW